VESENFLEFFLGDKVFIPCSVVAIDHLKRLVNVKVGRLLEL
jgi:hypothetical protein